MSFTFPARPDTAGSAALLAMIRTMMPVGFVHLTMDHRITVAGDTATQECAVVLARRDPSRAPGTSRWVTTGRYHDELRRTAQGWRFARRAFSPESSLRDLPKWCDLTSDPAGGAKPNIA
ncbi:MAG: nuclear transport factor 2 family protein [Microbacteriaceae bacterium]